jgi:photosystem II stability/assembly factor-like uncharacterized protein
MREKAMKRTIVVAILLCCAWATAWAGQWVSISDGVIAKLTADGKKPGWPGLTGGVGVDPASGDVYMVVCDQGIWRSSDKGQTFERVDGGKVGGRCETGFALNFDPNGKRLMCFMVYGGNAFTTDSGKTWTASKTSHVDFGAVDWEATGKCMLALRHENKGKLAFSEDGAQTWKDLTEGVKALGLFDAKSLLCSKGEGILRSTDGGATWTKVSDVTPAGAVMRVFKGTGYWTTKQGLLVSKDRGATWSVLGSSVDAVLGPHFGKDESHIVVVGKEGFQETTDGGKTWKLAAPLPVGFGVGPVGPNYAWDPIANVFYASSMGKPTLKYDR